MNKHMGSSLDSLLEEEGIKDEVDRRARRLVSAKRELAARVQGAMEALHLNKQALAKRMGTSRTVVYRLLDPKDTSVTLETIVRAEDALRRKFLFSPAKASLATGKRRASRAR